MENYKDVTSAALMEKIVMGRDSLQLLKIFPEEIWLMILEYITDSDDLMNLSNSSLYFRHHLHSNRIYFLFPNFHQIFRVKYLGAHYNQVKRLLCPPVNIDKIKELTKLESEHVKWPLFVKILRLVCPSWCHSIDKFYQNCDHHYSTSEANGSENPQFKVNFYEQKSTTIDKFLEQFGNTHKSGNEGRSPFLSRSVSFESRDGRLLFNEQLDEDYGEHYYQNGVETVKFSRFCLGITSLLEKYGHHIWYCNLAVQDKFCSRGRFYDKLNEWLELMPNLRLLDLKYYLTDMEDTTWWFREEKRELTPEENSELEIKVRNRPLPKLEHLKSLKTTNVPDAIFTELIRRNGHASCTGNTIVHFETR